MSSPEIILSLEQVLRRYLRAASALPSALPIYCAHEAEIVPAETFDFLLLHAARPALVADDDDGNFEAEVSLALFTGALLDEAARPDAVALHDARAASLAIVFDGISTAALAAINGDLPEYDPAGGVLAGTVPPPLVFSGWDRVGGQEDGRTDSGQLVARLRYVFDVGRV